MGLEGSSRRRPRWTSRAALYMAASVSSARAARSTHEKAHAFARPADAGRYVLQGSQPCVRDTDDFDSRQLLQVVDGRQQSVIQRFGFAIEVDKLHAVAEANRRVVTAGFEQPVDNNAGPEGRGRRRSG